MSPIEKYITDLLTPVIEAAGYELLWADYQGGILSLYCENPENGRITLDECAAISRAVSPVLEEDDPISGAYRLEVGSAGIDRPLLKARDYERFQGLEIKVELTEAPDPVNGQKRFRGRVEKIDGNIVTLKTEDSGMVDFDLSLVHKAKPVMNEELIKATKPNGEIAPINDVSNQ